HRVQAGGRRGARGPPAGRGQVGQRDLVPCLVGGEGHEVVLAAHVPVDRGGRGAQPVAPGSPRLGVLRRLRPAPIRSADDAPSPTLRTGCAGSGRTETVPVFTVIRSTKEEPSSIPAASPRLTRSTSPWPPETTPACLPGSSPSRLNATGAHRARPISARFEPVYLSRDVIALVPRVLLFITLAGPTPSGDPGASRLCQGCS